MTQTSRLDSAERVDLLCFLVLAQLSAAIAPQFLVFPCFRDAKEMVQLLVDGWQLDYRSATVRGMQGVCAERLMQR